MQKYVSTFIALFNFVLYYNNSLAMKIIKTQNYSIEIGSLLKSSFSQFIQNNYADSKVVIIVDENTHEYCLEYLITNFDFLAEAEVMLLPAGEENKVMEVCFQVWQAMSEYGVGRKDLIVNLGGGVVTDMGGFIASVYQRGIDFINIPTTLLGMVDASIGGKTGIDLGNLKNQLGVFASPKAIYTDITFLKTLEFKELRNGFAEMIKHSLIKDANFWTQLRSVQEVREMMSEDLIIKAMQIKNIIIEEDPLETGLRKILNFGHTAGHAIEGYFLDKVPLNHGHAVALGIIVESHISFKRGLISKSIFEEIESLILDWFAIHSFENEDLPLIIELLRFDKKNFNNKIQCCLLTNIGQCIYDHPVEENEFLDGLLYLMNRNVNLN